MGPAGWAAGVLSLLILLSPLPLAGLGIWLIAVEFPNIGLIFLGTLCLASAWFLRPRRQKPPIRTYGRADLPRFFEMLDRVAAELDAPKVDRVEISTEFDAWTYRSGRQREVVLSIGALLWLSLPPRGRLAVVAHELAHHVNGDPARYDLHGGALKAVQGWIFLLEPGEFEDEHGNRAYNAGFVEMIVNFFLWILVGAVSSVGWCLTRLIYFDNQRAEYLSDALSADIAGAEAVQDVLATFTMAPLIEEEARGAHVSGKVDGTAFLERFAKRIREAPEEMRAKYLAEAEEAKLTVDSTHPPTALRRAFVGLFAGRPVSALAEEIDMEAIDAELAGVIEAAGQRFADTFRRE